MASPKLSVVIASDHTIDRTLECLRALRAQAAPGDMQIIVADCSSDGTAEAIAQHVAEVEVIRFPEQIAVPQLLAAGLRQARGEIAAVLESRCIPQPGWTEAVLTLQKTANAVLGGTVEFDGSRRLVDWVAYFCDYGQFMSPRVAGPVAELPGNNCAFSRRWLEKYPDYTQPRFWKTFFFWQLQEKEGLRFISAPAMAVRYTRSFPTFSCFMSRRYHHARCFGAMRRAKFSRSRRWLYALLAPMLAPVLFWRILKNTWEKKRHRYRLILALPLIALASMVWAAGEWLGYLWGAGSSCEKVS